MATVMATAVDTAATAVAAVMGARERTMTKVICANCGKETEVPFVPRGDKPVYCSDCYNTIGAGSRNSGNSRY